MEQERQLDFSTFKIEGFRWGLQVSAGLEKLSSLKEQ